MDDLATCRECGAAVSPGELSRHHAWHARVTQELAALQQLQRKMQQAESNIQALDGGIQRVGAAVQTHRH